MTHSHESEKIVLQPRQNGKATSLAAQMTRTAVLALNGRRRALESLRDLVAYIERTGVEHIPEIAGMDKGALIAARQTLIDAAQEEFQT